MPAAADCRASKLKINSADSHCTEMASLLDPLIKNGTVPPLSLFTPDFAKKYGGANGQGADDARAGLVLQPVRPDTAHARR